MIEQIIFHKGQKTIPIDLETLERTRDYERGNKFPESHHELIRNILNLITIEGLTAEVAELFVAKTPGMYPKDKEIAFRTDINTKYDTRGVDIENLVAKINFTGELANDESCQSIALSYNKSGIEVSFGTNISVCSNMNIFGENYLSNHGSDSINFKKMVELIRLWVKTARATRERDLQLLEKMKSVTFTNYLKEIREIIGHFNEMLILNPNSAPLRQARITDVHRALLNGYTGGGRSLYQIYQDFTNISSHQDVIENRVKNTAEIGRYFVDRYGLNELDDGGAIVVDMNTILDKDDTITINPVELNKRVDEIITEIAVEDVSQESDTIAPKKAKQSMKERIHERAEKAIDPMTKRKYKDKPIDEYPVTPEEAFIKEKILVVKPGAVIKDATSLTKKEAVKLKEQSDTISLY